MIQGTGSSVGKSLLVAGLSRALTRRGLVVRPFKPQNMSNNAAIAADGGEIGRAQALQARACRTSPSHHMNPVLLKPQSEIGAQIVVQGKVHGQATARAYQAMKPQLLEAVLESFGILRKQADIVLVEGAGSASEINLRTGDIANMGFARAANVPVVIAGDIDRGGVIAALVGTKVVLDPDDAAMVRGFLVNRMRGDPSLFAEGMRLIEQQTGWEALGLVPHCEAARALPAEDAADLLHGLSAPTRPGNTVIAVPMLPHIANFDDLDPLAAEDSVTLVMVPPGQPLPVADAIIIPGSKTVIADLAALRHHGWDIDILAHRRRGRSIIGLCGGYQMLGCAIHDPQGFEGPAGSAAGLGLLEIETVLEPHKILTPRSGHLFNQDVPVSGYEMHMGITTGAGLRRPLLSLGPDAPEGCVSADGVVMGTYLHGLFHGGAFRRHLLATLDVSSHGGDHEDAVEHALDALADHMEAHVAIDRLLALSA
ncbi:Adenosylcobyric acid synthase (glutamine-hydrolysing) [Granulibacter bethesdensis]|uniref:Cobyric acid synthase n=1 Tax=Granulibacter bethesdensis TaxID=364410 RepID=A0AAN0VF86_9PROT|nr:cobyric acid synthase [Granulibacter bethesdensis]AHJ62438.1 Adenosylcobyric acid synthase (glutamine-hydrolysing) [Granulibacter bethesdensis]